jgi:hypothetical protein
VYKKWVDLEGKLKLSRKKYSSFLVLFSWQKAIGWITDQLAVFYTHIKEKRKKPTSERNVLRIAMLEP